MTPNPFAGLFHSRKFWMGIIDALVGSIALALLDNPKALDTFIKIYAMWQPVVVLIIGAIAYEDGANVKAKADLDTATMYESGAKIKADTRLLDRQAAEPAQPTVVINTGPAAPETSQTHC